MLGVTAEHPLYSGDDWVQAGDLSPGDVISDRAMLPLTVLAVRVDDTPQLVHNLEIGGAHTYFAGDMAAWAHNNTPPSLPPNNPARGINHQFGNPCPLPGTQVEHPPVHLNITAGGQTSRVGENGKPIFGDSLNRQQQRIVDCNRSLIRRTARKIRKWYRWHYGG